MLRTSKKNRSAKTPVPAVVAAAVVTVSVTGGLAVVVVASAGATRLTAHRGVDLLLEVLDHPHQPVDVRHVRVDCWWVDPLRVAAVLRARRVLH